MKAIHNSLSPGEPLEKMNKVILEKVLAFLDSPGSTGDKDGVPLFEWTRQFFSMASTDALYGPNNPLRDTKIMDGFWAIDKDFALLELDLMPELIAPRASRGRRQFFNAFGQYYATGGLETASHLVKARYKVNKRYGISDDDIAHFDLGVCTGLLVNTVPSICWTLCYVFSNAYLKKELRQGIEAAIYKQRGDSGPTTVNIPQLMKAFPLLESLVREVLRIQSNNASARFLLQDTLIPNDKGSTYLLKKDAILVVPSAPIHGSEAVWGPTASSFDPRRFLEQQDIKISGATYRTFGGGNGLCPGRHLAIQEIISILTIMVLKYDIEPVEGRWSIPRTRNHISTSILTPIKDIWVRIQPRKGVEHTT